MNRGSQKPIHPSRLLLRMLWRSTQVNSAIASRIAVSTFTTAAAGS